MVKTIIESDRVMALAYADAPYTPQQMITPSAIITAQQKYLQPVVGEAMIEALMEDKYIELYEDYVAPALALYVRFIVDGLGAPTAKSMLQRAREMMRRLSDHLEAHAGEYVEYETSRNILKRCSLDGGFIQIH
ncbi:MAG: hypothetical protein R3Y39_03265 [Rikenellaceae bacterium]